MNRRPSFLLGVIATAFASLVVLGAVAAAQTTPTGPPATSPPTTVLAPTTTSPAVTTSTPSETTTTTVPAAEPDSTDDTPWWLIAIVVALVAAIIGALAAWSRRGGRREQSTVDWHDHAASAVAEAGAASRILAGGTPADAGINQQIRRTLRTFEGLVRTAPDAGTRASAQRATEALFELSLALDADASARSAQPPFPPTQVAAAGAGVRNAASDADRTLSAFSRQLTEPA